MSEDQALEDARERITDYRDRIQHLDENSIALLLARPAITTGGRARTFPTTNFVKYGT